MFQSKTFSYKTYVSRVLATDIAQKCFPSRFNFADFDAFWAKTHPVLERQRKYQKRSSFIKFSSFF